MAGQNQTIHTNTLLTNFSTGYKLSNPVADFVAPPLKVNLDSGEYAQYTKSQNRVYDFSIKRREKAKEIQWNVTKGTYLCQLKEGSYFIEDALSRNSDKPIDLEKDAVAQLKMSMALAREYRVAQIAGSASFITNTTAIGADWAVVGTGTPVADILAAQAAIETNTAGSAMGNSIVIPSAVALKMITTTEWKSFFQYTDSGFNNGLFTAVSGLKNIGLEPMISGAHGLSTAKGTGSDPANEAIWSDNVLVFYRNANPTLQSRTLMFSPYTYKDNVDRIDKREEHGVLILRSEMIDENLVDAECGYLLTNCI